MTVTVRFAPSPTGHIHIGNARTALFNWLFATKAGGRFILRFDDTDVERSRREYADQIERDLAWLGIRPDEVEFQSRRGHLYEAAAERLRAAGLLYPCFETAEELERRRRIQLSRRLPPVYDRAALRLDAAARAAFEREGRRPHWRFLLPNFREDPFRPERTEIHWDDLMRGTQAIDLASMSDPVLIREDDTCLYTLPSVVDDIDMGITHVIRGDDHVTNTGAQIALFRALGGREPVFGHHNLLTAASGEGLSKRGGALSIRGLAEAGYEPMAVASLAVLIGTSQPVHAVGSLDQLAELFEPSIVSKSAARFDPDEVAVLNHALVKDLAPAAVAGRLQEMGVPAHMAEAFWLAVRGNITRVAEAADWWRIVADGPSPDDTLAEEDRPFIAEAARLLPAEPWGEATWKEWTEAVKAATGRKGKALFLPLRIALTGRAAGPELAALLPLIGRQAALKRLR